jgi:outer membrane protein assembly factor BamD (BamD/ComL family)
VKDPIRAAEAVKLTEQDEKLLGMRHAITQSIAQQQLHEASDKYIELLEFDSSQVLPRDQQLDIGNQLAGDGRHLMAAQAYELFLQAFPKDHDRDQVELMLGLLCVRYLDRKQRGRELLQAALKTLRDPAHVDLARAALAQIDAH